MFAVGPNPWMHYKFRPYDVDDIHQDIVPPSHLMASSNDKNKSSTEPLPKDVKHDSKHAKAHKHTTWIKTKEVAEHVKDGIASTFASVASCVKPGGHISANVVDGRKITTIKENDVLENPESDVHGVFDADTKTWHDIKARVDCTLKQSKDYPGVNMDSNKACCSGYTEHREYKRKKSLNSEEKDKVDRELKNIAHCVLGTHDDTADSTWEYMKARTDAILEKNTNFTDEMNSNSTDFDENVPQRERTRTISLTEEDIHLENSDLATIWKVEEKFEITKDDIIGPGPENVNFIIKGGFNTIHATTPEVNERRREAIAASAAWEPTVHLLEECDDIPMEAFVNDENVCPLAQQHRDMDAIIADLRYI